MEVNLLVSDMQNGVIAHKSIHTSQKVKQYFSVTGYKEIQSTPADHLWYIIYENIFRFDKVMCKLLIKCHFFHIFTDALIHKHAFTILNVTQN